ncbi:hypothetical protein [Psychrobacillus soli]|nr:hypothetical protein [Psychrobacillus soli]
MVGKSGSGKSTLLQHVKQQK